MAGSITLDDLKSYRAIERTPLTGSYRGYTIVTAPPPSSGGVGILQMLGVLEGSGYEKSGFGSATEIHFLAETMRRYFADRSEYMGDPDFYHVPIAGLLNSRYIARATTVDRPGSRDVQCELCILASWELSKAAIPRITRSWMPRATPWR